MLAPPDLLSRETELRWATGSRRHRSSRSSFGLGTTRRSTSSTGKTPSPGMLSASDLEIELAAAEGRIRSAVERGGVIAPDHTLTLGERTYYYFLRERDRGDS